VPFPSCIFANYSPSLKHHSPHLHDFFSNSMKSNSYECPCHGAPTSIPGDICLSCLTSIHCGEGIRLALSSRFGIVLVTIREPNEVTMRSSCGGRPTKPQKESVRPVSRLRAQSAVSRDLGILMSRCEGGVEAIGEVALSEVLLSVSGTRKAEGALSHQHHGKSGD
jgi:hypothetical protein